MFEVRSRHIGETTGMGVELVAVPVMGQREAAMVILVLVFDFGLRRGSDLE